MSQKNVWSPSSNLVGQASSSCSAASSNVRCLIGLCILACNLRSNYQHKLYYIELSSSATFYFKPFELVNMVLHISQTVEVVPSSYTGSFFFVGFAFFFSGISKLIGAGVFTICVRIWAAIPFGAAYGTPHILQFSIGSGVDSFSYSNSSVCLCAYNIKSLVKSLIELFCVVLLMDHLSLHSS